MYNKRTEDKQDLERNPDIMGFVTDVLLYAGPTILTHIGLTYLSDTAEEEREAELTKQALTDPTILDGDIEIMIAQEKLMPSLIKAGLGIAGFAGIFFFGNKIPEWAQKAGYGVSTGLLLNSVSGFMEMGTVKKDNEAAWTRLKDAK